MSKRIDYLDVAKAIGIVLVMISHSCGMPFNSTMYFSNFYIQLFWIISGMTYKDGEKIAINIKKKCARILKPYVIYNVIILILNILLQNIKSFHELVFSIEGILYSRYALYPLSESNNVYFLQIGNSPLWFLTSMFTGCCIFYGVIAIIGKSIKKLCVVNIVLLLMTVLLRKFPILLPWSIDTSFLTAWFMLFGYCMINFFVKRYYIISMLICSILYLLGCYWNGAVNMSIRIYGCHGVLSIFATCILGIMGSLICFSISRMIEKILILRRIFAFIGRNTIILLALHMSIFKVFDQCLQYLKIVYDNNAILWYGVGIMRILITIIICLYLVWVKSKFAG